RDTYDLTLAERLLAVVARLGLDTIDSTVGADGVCGKQGTRQQTTAPHGDEQGIQATGVFEQLFDRRALPRNDVGVIERWDQRESLRLHQFPRNLFPVLP